MTIKYAPFQRWMKPVTPEPESLYGRSNQKRIRSTLSRVAEHDISYDFRPLDDEFLRWFTPFYEQTIGSKQNAAVHDLHAMTLGNVNSTSVYWSLTLRQNGTNIGGTILGVRDDRVMIAYRTYPQKWGDGLSLQANPSLYTEYLVSAWAYELGKQWISHGKDRNPYGLNAAIGLAIFKLSVGCTPSIIRDNDDYQPLEFDVSTLNEDALVLHYPTSDETITEATLFTDRQNESRYSQLQKYPDLLAVKVSYR